MATIQNRLFILVPVETQKQNLPHLHPHPLPLKEVLYEFFIPIKKKKKAIPSNKSPTQVLSSKDFSVKLFVSSKCAPLCFNLISPEWMDILTTLAFYLLLSMSYFNYFKIPNIYQKEKKKKTIMLSFTYFYQNTLNCSLSVSIIMQKYKDPTQPTQKIGYLYNYIRQVCVDLT